MTPPPPLRRQFQRYVLSLQYNGQLFSGSSGHPSTKGACRARHPSVQESVEAALTQFASAANIRDVQFSSRTDAGVHALGNTLHVEIERRRRKTLESLSPHPAAVVQRALNSTLANKGIGITSASTVPSSFHARFDAKHRTYMYRLLVLPKASSGWRCCLFEQDKSWIMSPRYSNYLNVELMRAAALPLLGRHDFSSFRNSGCQANSAVRTLDVLDIRERRWSDVSLPPDLTGTEFTPFDFFQSSTMGLNGYIPGSSGAVDTSSGGGGAVEGDPTTDVFAHTNSLSRIEDLEVQEIIVTVRARSFLYNQVRNLVGFLVNQGDSRVRAVDTKPDDIANVGSASRELLNKMDRNFAPPKAPARGLYLTHVEY